MAPTTLWEMHALLTPVGSRHDQDGEEVIGPVLIEEPKSPAAKDRQRALTIHLMEQVCQPANLNRAYKKVLANKGSPGVDGMTVGKLGDWIKRHKQELIDALLDGSYQPQPVRGVQIPKPGGKGMRQLGIPTVVDRLVQQAIRQVLEPILDPTFSASSYGLRPGRGAHEALKSAQKFVAEGRTIVVDTRPREVLRQGEPRRIDGASGPMGGGQTHAEDHRPVPASRPDERWGRLRLPGRVRVTRRGHAARRSALAVAGQSAAG